MKPAVTIVCGRCQRQFDVPFASRKKRFCSRRCATGYTNEHCDRVARAAKISKTRRENIASGKVVQVGRPHTEETKRRLSEKARIRMSGPTNHFLGKRRSEASREKQSRTRAQRFVDGTYRWKTWTEGGHLETAKAGKIFCRSSWEKNVAEMLDADPAVVTFEVEPFSIQYYLHEGGRQHLRHYIPDFLVTYVDGRRVLVEVKPECFVDADINVAKFVAAREHCAKNGFTFEVWTQRHLGTSSA